MGKGVKKSGGWGPTIVIIVVIAVAGFVGGRMLGSKKGAIEEHTQVDPYPTIVEIQEDYSEDEAEELWDEDSPSNYADEESLE